MKNRDLIEHLSEFDLDADVVIVFYDDDGICVNTCDIRSAGEIRTGDNDEIISPTIDVLGDLDNGGIAVEER